jgi:uncharacterized protein
MLSLGVTPKTTYILRLLRGEEVLATLTDFCKREGIQGAVFTALGAVEKTKLGYYDLATRQYGSKEYEREHEVASMTGNVALVDGKPFIHVHAVLSGIASGTENQCVGGHVFASTVAVTLEVHLAVFNQSLTRSLDEGVGLKLLDCPSAAL